MERHPEFMDLKDIAKISIPPKVIYLFNNIPTKIPMVSYTELEKNSKNYMES
jgi:hypothetical protein